MKNKNISMNISIFITALTVSILAENVIAQEKQINCALVLCAAPPKDCPNGAKPAKAPNGCCTVCPTIDCSLVRCAAPPTKCPNGEAPVKPTNSCCYECPSTTIDCSLVRCAAPTKYCKDGQVPKPNGQCCATCKPNCAAVLCLACEDGQKEISNPNSCCPLCQPVVY